MPALFSNFQLGSSEAQAQLWLSMALGCCSEAQA